MIPLGPFLYRHRRNRRVSTWLGGETPGIGVETRDILGSPIAREVSLRFEVDFLGVRDRSVGVDARSFGSFGVVIDRDTGLSFGVVMARSCCFETGLSVLSDLSNLSFGVEMDRVGVSRLVGVCDRLVGVMDLSFGVIDRSSGAVPISN